MKLKNCKVGQRVETKDFDIIKDVCRFYQRHCGKVGTITGVRDPDTVTVEFDDGTSDYGHHSLIRKVK